jgi:hypothetical protein
MPEPLIPDEGAASAEDADWLRGVAAKLADAIAGDHSVSRSVRCLASSNFADAFEDLCYELGAKPDRAAFLRRCDTPTLREAK